MRNTHTQTMHGTGCNLIHTALNNHLYACIMSANGLNVVQDWNIFRIIVFLKLVPDVMNFNLIPKNKRKIVCCCSHVCRLKRKVASQVYALLY